jgi:formate C-acetyltransferase
MATVDVTLSARTLPTERVLRLRDHALCTPVPPNVETALHGGESWMATRGETWWGLRRGQRVAHVLRNLTPEIGPDDLLVGRIPSRPLTEEEAARLQAAGEFMAAQPAGWGQAGHMAPDLERLLTRGCRGVQADIEALAAALDPVDPEAAPKLAFYRAAREALDGLCDFAAHYAEASERLADACEDPERAEELREIAEVCRRVPAGSAETFHEALQSAHFLLFAANVVDGAGLTSPGSLDRWLIPYLRADLESGRLTPEGAQELLDCFFVTFNHYIGSGLAIGMLLGGRDAEGRDVTNELTWMALRAVDHTRMAYPSAGLRVHRDTDPELLDLALAILAEGVSQPALFNDEVITESLQRMGLPLEDACDYMNSTCVEITPSGKSNVWVASPYYNLPQILLDLIGEVAEGRLAAPADLDALFAEYAARLGGQIAAGVAEQNRLRHSCLAHRHFPLTSCFVHDCLESGQDLDCGGARYNWIECSFVGLATATDGLAALQRFVFGSGELAWRELHAMLQRNFEGDEAWRRRLIHEPGKYGNDDPEVDALAGRIMEAAVEHCHRHRVVFDSTYEPGLFAWIMHGELGRGTGATPDGRLAGVALSPGPDPSPGRANRGPTAAALSVTSFDHTPLIGGVAFNMKFSRAALASAEQRRKLAALVRTYFARGGFQTQVTTVDADTLRAAREHPEDYADLLVRVAGYSDYFVRLSPLMQDEMIARTELAL